MTVPNLGDREYQKFAVESDDSVYVKTKDITLDNNVSANKVIDYTHHEMHSGSHYFYKSVIPFNGGADETQYLMFTTPNTDVLINAKASIYGSLEFDIKIYEGGTVSANGTELDAFNNLRDSTNTPGLTLYTGPTVTDVGTLIWYAKTGAGRAPASVQTASSYEIIAKKNTIYLYEIVKIPANVAYIDADFWWYEHEQTVT